MTASSTKGAASPTTVRSLTQHEMVLIAMAHSAEWTTRKIPYEDLVLQAWRDFPAEFSLRNHPEHPDGSDIHKRLYQTLRPGGLVVSLGNKTFRLTDKGIAEARSLDRHSDASDSDSHPPARLGREQRSFLTQAMTSRAFATWRNGMGEQLIDYDARVFFQFSTGTPIPERRLRVVFADEAIGVAQSLRLAGSAELAALSRYLQESFVALFAEP